MKVRKVISTLIILFTMESQAQTNDKSQIEALYKQMYRAMVEKDTVTLNQVHADEFVLTHMTGTRQSKK